ncbi:MAG TPA: GNAT family N-acetyltransferase [Bacteroidia bacterium]|jgi:GNAT superfamily N-acetyltransferase|nr:GNAT family N-acetyltransferase [Bacteroidia bacterium]
MEKSTAFEIREMHSYEEMLERYEILTQLNPQLKKEDYARMLHDMLAHGYRQVAVFDGKQCIGVSGFWISTKLYCDKYVELDNVIIDAAYRSKGVGKLMCDWIVEEGKRLGCITALLDAYVENSNGHRFYFREGYVIKGFHFLKKLI